MKDLLLGQIRAELKRRNITQADIADRLGKSTGTVSMWLSKGKITLNKLDEVLAVYEIEIDKIVFK